MNDQNQPQNAPIPQAPVAAQPVVEQPQQAPVPQQVPIAPAPVSVPNKEHVPAVTANETLLVQEFVKPTEHEPNLPPEVKEAGVQVQQNTPQLTDDHKKVGVFHAPEITTTTPSFTPTVNYVLSPEEEKAALKKSPTYSIRWLAQLQQKVREQFFGKTTKVKEGV